MRHVLLGQGEVDLRYADPVFGLVTMHARQRPLQQVVAGVGIPTVEIKRVAGPTAFDGLAELPGIYVRDPQQLGMTVGGTAVTLEPGPGRLRRASYGARVVANRVVYEWRQLGRKRAALVRDGTQIAVFRRSDLTHHETRWEPATSTVDAGIAHALAYAYGVGADGAVANFFAELSG